MNTTANCIENRIMVHNLGQQDYQTTWQQMQQFTNQRTHSSVDELWCTEHFPVFTQGQAGKAEHILDPGKIPVVQSDRGGQITYHGPGQLVVYLLIDIKRRHMGVRTLVNGIEQAVIDCLSDYELIGQRRERAPGVYVNGAKICALGLRIRRGCSYHGLSLNINMDLEPFSRINPCGMANCPVTQLSHLARNVSFDAVRESLCTYLQQYIGSHR